MKTRHDGIGLRSGRQKGMGWALSRYRNYMVMLACAILVGCGQTATQSASSTKPVTDQSAAGSTPAMVPTDNTTLSADNSTEKPPITAATGASISATTDTGTDTGTASDDADIISNIIWDMETAQAEPPVAVEAVIPEGPDPSLAKDALAAAFAMLSRQTTPPPKIPAYSLPPKNADGLRVALLVPMTGANAALGNELRRGAELALFAMGDRRLELLVFDSAGLAGSASDDTQVSGAAIAAHHAADAGADIIIGPLFSNAVMPARAVADLHDIPMLLLSNNTDVSGQNSWLMGYVPEQQLDLVLAHAISNGTKKFAVLAQDSAFGLRLKRHAETRLANFGFPILESRTLGPAELADEAQLKGAIKAFARYQDQPQDENDQNLLPEPAYDAVIFAGDANFALRTAPVLAYYDIGSDRVSYLGNALWKQSQLLIEPSLQNSVFAARPSNGDAEFTALWKQTWQDQPGLLARLSFDALAMIGLLARDKPDMTAIDWPAMLTTDSGFSGFSGAFRLLPDGTNLRAFELRQIIDGSPALLVQAPNKI